MFPLIIKNTFSHNELRCFEIVFSTCVFNDVFVFLVYINPRKIEPQQMSRQVSENSWDPLPLIEVRVL